MYATTNFKTKEAFKEAVDKAMAGTGPQVTVYQPGGIFEGTKTGRVCIEGPHFPEAHKWYATAEIVDRVVVSKVK